MLFELEDVTYSRAGDLVLDRLNIRLPVGSSCVVGPSGCGKSTLLRLLNRLADPDSGRVLYEGDDVREREPLALRREVCPGPAAPGADRRHRPDNVAYGPRLAGHSFDAGAASSSPGWTPGSRTVIRRSSRSASSSG